MGEVVMGQMVSKVGKDTVMCYLKGLAESMSTTSEGKEAAFKTLDAIKESMDRSSDMKKAWSSGSYLWEKGRTDFLKDKDRKTFAAFLDKKAWDRYKGLPKTGNAIKAIVEYMDTPDRKSRVAELETETKIKACEFDSALESAK